MEQQIINCLLIIMCVFIVKYFLHIETFDSLDTNWKGRCNYKSCQDKINYLTDKKLSYDSSTLVECNGCPIVHYNNVKQPFFTLPQTTLNGSITQIFNQSSLPFKYDSQGLFKSADNAYCAFVVNFTPPPSNPPPQNQYLFFTTLTNGVPDLPSSGKGSSNPGGWYGIGSLNLSCLKINNPMSVYPEYPISTTDYNKLSPPASFGNQQWTNIVNP